MSYAEESEELNLKLKEMVDEIKHSDASTGDLRSEVPSWCSWCDAGARSVMRVLVV